MVENKATRKKEISAIAEHRVRLITHGNGAATVMIPAKKAVAPTVPILAYICPAKSGNAAANTDRTNAFAAITEAAMGLYADTKYVKVDVKHRRKPIPNAMDAIIGAIQCTCLYVVKAIQNKLTGTITAPTRPVRSRASGGTSAPGCFFWVYLQHTPQTMPW